MSRDIAKILKNQRKRRILGQSDDKLDFVLSSLLQEMLQEEISDYLDKVKNNLESELESLKKQLNYIKQIRQPKDGYTPIKGKDYFDGKDVDENQIIKNVLSKIKIKDGKDADEKKILEKLLKIIKLPENGYTPVKGKDYFDGKDGSPDTPEQIANKLNTLEEKVEIKVIKGLETYFNNINKKIQEVKSQKSSSGSGGSSNTIHESRAVDSATTSITLQYNVANNGNKIFIGYSGGVIEKDVHYTVSGKNITLLETLQDNTYLYIIYDRA
jgi:hypothetical protein